VETAAVEKQAVLDAVKPDENDAVSSDGRITLGYHIYKTLRERLAGGEYETGQQLSLRKLAASLGTSSMPVRDALLQLTVERAVELLPNRTFCVPKMSTTRLTELRDIRVNLEGMAIERAAKSISPIAWQRASQISNAFTEESNRATVDTGKLIRLNMLLHFTIYREAGSDELLRMIESIWTQIGPALNYDVKGRLQPGSRRSPCEYHQGMIDALGRRDSTGARDALEGDINNTYNFIVNLNILE
jgi:DNA-binding GntR family transcriptional regulator